VEGITARSADGPGMPARATEGQVLAGVSGPCRRSVQGVKLAMIPRNARVPLVMPMSALLVALAATVLVLVLVLVRIGPGLGADFTIRHRPGGRVEVRGRIPAAKVGAIRVFFARDLQARCAGTVWGWYGPGRVLRLRFGGGLSPGQRQQARNFLIEHLR
jgi:hypothetical protein